MPGDRLGQHVRQEEQQAEHRPAAEAPVEQDGEPSENGIWMGSDSTMMNTLLPTAFRNTSLAERTLVVLEADEVGQRLEAVPLVQAEVRGLDDRAR